MGKMKVTELLTKQAAVMVMKVCVVGEGSQLEGTKEEKETLPSAFSRGRHHAACMPTSRMRSEEKTAAGLLHKLWTPA